MHLAREAEDNCTVGEEAQRWAEADNQPGCKAQGPAPWALDPDPEVGGSSYWACHRRMRWEQETAGKAQGCRVPHRDLVVHRCHTLIFAQVSYA